MQKGSIIIPLILIIIVAFGVLMTTDTLYNKTATNPLQFFTDPRVDQPNKDVHNLKLEKLKFKPYVPPTFDCGDDGSIILGEARILWAISPDPGTPVTAEGSIKAFYMDEMPLTLGSGNVSPSPTGKDHVTNPNVGDETARDANNFPYYPALFISDITSDPNNRSGDAQNGGTPHKPSEVFGAWKALGNNVSVPPSNGYDLGPGADPWPTKSNVTFTKPGRGHEPGYVAEIVWNASSLGLTSGHTYRAQFILHDGDQEGDTSEGCTTIQY